MNDRHHTATHHYNLGVQFESEGELERAREEFERALKEDPQFPYPYRALGELQYRDGEIEAARQSLSAALRLDPGWIEVMALLARVEYECGNNSRALELQETALRHDPKNPEYNCLLGKINIALNKYGEAVSCLEAALEQQQNSAQLHYSLGIAYGKRALADLDQSLSHWQACSRLDPADPQVFRNLGIALFTKGALNEAAAAFAKSLELDPSDSVAARFLKYAEGVKQLG